MRKLFKVNHQQTDQIEVELQEMEIQESSDVHVHHSNPSSNVIVRESNNEHIKSVVVVIQHQIPQENTMYHCQLQ